MSQEGKGTGKRMIRQKEKAFTLIEIMVVVAIVATLAALAVSSMLRSRMNANEVAAIAGCRNISTGNQNFYGNSNPHTYPSALTDLTSPTSNPAYIDSVLATGTRQGYIYSHVLVDAEHFRLNADPVNSGTTGTRHFFVDQTGVLRANATVAATASDPPVE